MTTSLTKDLSTSFDGFVGILNPPLSPGPEGGKEG